MKGARGMFTLHSVCKNKANGTSPLPHSQGGVFVDVSAEETGMPYRRTTIGVA